MATRNRLWLAPAAALLLTVPVLTVPAPAKPAPAKPTPKRELQSIYNKMDAALARKDVDGVFDYNDEDYTTIDQKGRVYEASEGRQETQEVLDLVDSIKATSTIQSFTGTDTEATVTVKDHVVLMLANTVTGRVFKLIQDDVCRDHWTYTPDGWRRMRSRILSGKNAFRKNF